MRGERSTAVRLIGESFSELLLPENVGCFIFSWNAALVGIPGEVGRAVLLEDGACGELRLSGGSFQVSSVSTISMVTRANFIQTIV